MLAARSLALARSHRTALRPVSDVRGHHGWRDRGTRAPGAGDRRGARRRRARLRPRSTTSVRSGGSRPGCSPTTPFPHTFLDVVGLQRELNAAQPPAQRRDGAQAGHRRAPGARAAPRALRPQVVVSVGGYASLPAVLAARRAGSRSSSSATTVCPAGPRGWRRASPPPRRSPSPTRRCREPIVTGAPVRRSRSSPSTAPPTAPTPARRLDLPDDRFVVAVTGGSQGSAALNAAVAGIVAERAADDRPGGPPGRRRPLPRPASPVVDALRRAWLHRVGRVTSTAIELVYAAADLLIGRGGATTVHEVAVTGTPAVLVPVGSERRGPPDAERPLARRPGRRGHAPRGRARPAGRRGRRLRADPQPARRPGPTGRDAPARCTGAGASSSVIDGRREWPAARWLRPPSLTTP